MQDLRNKTVWITGASSGIGEALAHAFAARGAKLVLSARRADRLAEVARNSNARNAQILPLDLTDVAALKGKVSEVLARHGAVDVMVHNAGLGQRGLACETDFSVDRQLMDVNYFGPIALTKALLPSMLARRSGQFVVMSSVLGLFSAKRRTGYAAAKHALHGFFNGLRAEVADDRISVLLVCPGHVHTEFSERALEADGTAHGVVDAASSAGLSPAHCAARTLAALDAGDDEVLIARWEALVVYLQRMSPALLRYALARAKLR